VAEFSLEGEDLTLSRRLMGRLCKISIPSMSQTLSFLIQPLKISIAPGRWMVML